MTRADLEGCPLCGSESGHVFYTLANAPVHSCSLQPSPQTSLQLAKGTIELKGCQQCSMVWNRRFIAEQMSYDSSYEETQSYSKEFQRFQDKLAREIFDSLGMHGKSVIEIGCGKGEFLSRLGELGIGSGVGFDPGVDHSRLQHIDGLAFRAEFFPPAHNPPHADIYLCLMTLEHISRPRQFLISLRQHIADREAKLVFLVPDFARIASELAFWDIYYEHCLYFTQASLRSLFTSAGFKVLSEQNRFSEQYLQVVASPIAAAPEFQAEQPMDFQALEHGFHHALENSPWPQFATAQNSVLIWGAASKAVGLLSRFPELAPHTTLVDINPHKHGTYLPGTANEIVSPENLRGTTYDQIVIANPNYRQEIIQALTALSIKGPVGALGVEFQG